MGMNKKETFLTIASCVCTCISAVIAYLQFDDKQKQIKKAVREELALRQLNTKNKE